MNQFRPVHFVWDGVIATQPPLVSRGSC